MVYVKIRTMGDYGEEAEYEGEAEEAYEAISEQEKTFRESPAIGYPKVTEVEIEGQTGNMSDDDFEEYLTDLYGEVNVGWITSDSGYIIRNLYPQDFQMAKGEHESYAVEELYDDIDKGDTPEEEYFWDKVFRQLGF